MEMSYMTSCPYLSKTRTKSFHSSLFKWWYDSNSVRRERQFFWRKWILNTKDKIVELEGNTFSRDFGIFCVETVLKKTNADSVENHFRKFFQKYQSFSDVKHAKKSDLKQILEKLGLYSQHTDSLKHRAKIIVNDFNSKVPDRKEDIRKVMKKNEGNFHIYFVEAVALYIHSIKSAPVDSNVIRIYERLFSITRTKVDIRNDHEFCDFAKKLLPHQKAVEYNLAILDLGALKCINSKRKPKCEECPVGSSCDFYKLSKKGLKK